MALKQFAAQRRPGTPTASLDGVPAQRVNDHSVIGADFNLAVPTVRDEVSLSEQSMFPPAGDAPTIVICDFEVKHADVVGFIAREVRSRYPGASLYFAVFGAMTKGRTLDVDDFDDLTGAGIMRAAGFDAVFIAATMSPPGIEPPLELR